MTTQLLLADDSPTIAKILQMALQNEEYSIRSVLNAEDALRELKASPPTLFLVDLALPEKNGYEFARLIKQDSKLSKVRVVLLASAFDPIDELAYHESGADALVKKPFDPTELRTKLRALRDAPPKFPAGSKVSGSLSGFEVSHVAEPTGQTPMPMILTRPIEVKPGELTAPAPAAAAPAESSDPLAGLLSGSAPSGEADSILAGILGGGDAPPAAPPAAAPSTLAALVEAPPAAPANEVVLGMLDSPSADAGQTAITSSGFMQMPASVKPEPAGKIGEMTNATVALDLSGADNFVQQDSVLDLSGAFSTPAGGTAMIETGSMDLEGQIPPAAPAPAAPDVPLSANAEALAAFFSAEIKGNLEKTEEVTEVPPATEDEAFDSSLDSIEWGASPTPAAEKLNDWSSSAPKGAPKAPPPRETPPPAPRPAPAAAAAAPPSTPKAAPKAAPKPAPKPRSPVGGADSALMFDTGGSSFRFSDDYVQRITKSFSGSLDEHVPESHKASSFFPQASNDDPSAPLSGGGAWSEADVARIEKIVREEVQMVVREVAEKIAWEVIPELAENIIRKELERVLKEMGQ